MTVSTILDQLVEHATTSNNLKLLAALGAFILFKYRSHTIGTRPRPDLKQPKGIVPLLGHLPLMLSIPGTKLYDFFLDNNKELGPVWSISIPFFGRIIQCDTPEMVEHILKTSFWNYEKGDKLKSKMFDLLGKGIFASDGHEWKSQRKLASHVFSVKAFKEYTSDVFVIEGQLVVDYLIKAADEGTIVDLQELFLSFTLDCFGTISFGKNFGCLENMDKKVDFATSFDDLASACSDRLMDPLWKFREAVTSVGKKAAHDKNVIRRHALDIIERRRREGFHAEKKDLLQLFLDSTDDDGNPLSEDFIVDIILNFTIAGRDTTAQALSWTFYLLGRDEADPQIIKNLVNEVDDALHGELPSYESHKQLKFAEACFYETLRLFPSVPRNLKECVKDDVFPDGTKVHKGEFVCWSSYVMGRSEDIWGPDAKEYKPSRWINTEKPSQGKFSAFHAGPRVCLGQQFATVEALTIMGMILSKVEFELVEPTKFPGYGVSVSLPLLHGLPVRVRRRKNDLSTA
ncbi:hypothetical protein BGX27_002788 [Mortierella sp. AM989]|nr:hypothetical protein BGX27_002788 [Mortierella sp. AM989]